MSPEHQATPEPSVKPPSMATKACDQTFNLAQTSTRLPGWAEMFKNSGKEPSNLTRGLILRALSDQMHRAEIFRRYGPFLGNSVRIV